MPDNTEAVPSRSLPDLEHYRGYLKSIAVVQLGVRLQSKVDPSDVVQETMTDAIRDLDKFKGQDEAQFKAWLRTILTNNLKGLFREWGAQCRNPKYDVPLAQQIEQSSLGLEQFLAAEQTSPSQRVLRNERYDQLAEALTRLPEEQRVAVILKYFQHWPLAEIAAHMDKSVTAVGGLLKRGLKRLKQLLSEDTNES